MFNRYVIRIVIIVAFDTISSRDNEWNEREQDRQPEDQVYISIYLRLPETRIVKVTQLVC